MLQQHENGIQIDGTRLDGLLRAKRRTHQTGQRHDDVRFLQQRQHQALIAHITADDREMLMGAAIQQGRLAIHEIIHHRDAIPARKQGGNENGAQITGATRDENMRRVVHGRNGSEFTGQEQANDGLPHKFDKPRQLWLKSFS